MSRYCDERKKQAEDKLDHAPNLSHVCDRVPKHRGVHRCACGKTWVRSGH